MAEKIDVDRGVELRQIVAFDKVNPSKFVPDPKYGGMSVYMYVGEPGVYYDVHGNKVPETMAELAGFETKKNAKLLKKQQAMADFNKLMDEQLAMETDEVEIIKEQGDWQVIALAAGRAKVVDKETGLPVTPTPLPRADALKLLTMLSNEASAEGVSATATKKGTSNGSTAS